MVHYPPLAQVRFPGEVLTHGDPDLRPERGGGIISRTPGMDALEADFRSRALLATVGGRRPPISPEALVQSLARICGVERRHVRVEVSHPADFFITFASTSDCDRVFLDSGKLRCKGAPIAFQRWHRSALASSGSMEFFCRLGIEGLPANAWEWGAISQLLNNLNGQLVEILPPDDRWQLQVTAWLKNLSAVPKIYDLEIPEPVGLLASFEEDNPASPPLPAPPTERITLIHPLTIHVIDVVDRTVPYLELRPNFQPDDDEDLTRRHDYSRSCYWGRIDGTGRGNVPNSGGHPFGGPGGYGMAGDWGGGPRVMGVLAPAGGMAIPARLLAPGSAHPREAPVQATRSTLMTASGRPGSWSSSAATAGAHAGLPAGNVAGSPVTGSPLAAVRSCGSLASTAVGSRALADTPLLLGSEASTAVGSKALGSTPPVRNSALWGTPPHRRLSFSPTSQMQAGKGTQEMAGMIHADQAGEEEVEVQGCLGHPQAHQEDNTDLLQEVGLSVRVALTRSASSSPIQTPFVVPLPQHMLLPPASARVGTGTMQGPMTASETLRLGLVAPPAPSILGPRPAASAPVKHRKALPPNFTPRRSARLCKNAPAHNTGPVQRAQSVLLKRMGVIQAEEQVSSEALDEYLKLFDKPLAPHHVKAITTIFAPGKVDFDEPP
ncbi:hypothetical protein VPH35_106214 [Triticum aestivum]